MDLTNLRFFYHVARHLSFTKAAEDLSVKQPSVTRRIKLLEEETGLQLFGRRGGKSFLTEEGFFLFEHAKRVMDYEKIFENKANELRELKRGLLRIGVHKTFMDDPISYTIDHFHKRYPDVRMHVNTGSAVEIMHSVLNHSDEIAIHAVIEKHPDIEYLHISRLGVILIVCPGHPFAEYNNVSPKMLADEPIILTETGSGTRKLVIDLFEKNNLTPNILLESSQHDHIKHLVQEGKGISLLMERAVFQEINEGKLVKVPIKGERLILNTYIFYLKNVSLTLPAIAYLNIFARIGSKIPNYPHLMQSWSKKCKYISDDFGEI